MDSLPHALQLMKPNCWMAVLDLKDAYYSVPIRTEDRKYLRFEHEGQLYEFVCLPNGLSSAPRIFTKLLKPALAKLREEGVLLVIYIDDIILFADDPQTLVIFIQRAITLCQSLGFTIHSDKSQLVPSQRVNFLGFILDSVVMTVSMKSDKADKAKSAILQLLRTEKPLIREVASVVGQMVSCFPGVKYGPLYYRALENDKTDALKTNGWNLDDRMLISDIAKKDMSWWFSNIDNDPCSVRPMKYKLTLKCDSSLQGWGSVIENSSLAANGRWSHSESMCHINYLEIKAVLFGLQSLCSDLTYCNIKVLSDNQTAVSYLRNMGGTHSRDCNEIARETLLWCKDRGISLAVTHLPGKLNVEADLASRHFHDDTEWSLDTHVYNSLITKWGNPEIDLFASRLNAKLPCYAAWKPDPCAHFIDAFTLDWSVFKLVYCFPPFSVIGKVLQKIVFYNSNPSSPRLANTVLVPTSNVNASGASTPNKAAEVNPDPSPRCQDRPSPLPQAPTDWLSCVRKSLQLQGITGETLNIIIDSWRESTRKQYRSSISAWITYCKEQKISITTPSLPQLLDFLTLQSTKLSYSALGTTRSALSSFINIAGFKVGEHPIISRFMSGAFNRKPTFPRYVETWNPQIVLSHLKGYPDTKAMSLKQLTLKLTMILALVTAQRTQTLKLLSINDMQSKDGEYVFQITSILKQTSAHGGRQRHLPPIVLKKYDHDKTLCVFTLLHEYLIRTSNLRGSCSQLLICHCKPHGPASKDTISRWLKQVMLDAGINTSVFKPHSTRSAATSAAKSADVPLNEIMTTAGWRSSSVFAVYYNKPLLNDSSFANSVLGKN